MFFPFCSVSSFVPQRLSVASADLFRIVKKSGASGDDAAGDSFASGAVGLGIRRRSSAEIVDAFLDDETSADDVGDVEHFVNQTEGGATGSVGDHVA